MPEDLLGHLKLVCDPPHGPRMSMGEYFTHGGRPCRTCGVMLPLCPEERDSATFPLVAPVPTGNNERPMMDHKLFELAAVERERQVNQGATPEHDDAHDNGELAFAAAAYALPGTFLSPIGGGHRDALWPWDRDSWQPSPDNRRRELAKAAALLAAEWDRLDRLEAKS